MTVSAVTPVINYTYIGPGQYDFGFLTFKETDITVRYVTESGEITTLTPDVDYTVFLIPDQTTEGGYVTVLATQPQTTGILEIARILPIDQPVDWINNDPLDAEVLETSMDRLTMMMQQMAVIVAGENVVLSWRGDWLPDTDYNIKDMVIDPVSGNWYYCVESHTSSDSLTTDIATGYWLLALDMEEVNNLVGQAAQSASNALTSEQNAKASEEIAVASADSAADSEANSAMSEINAANCAVEANQSAAEAKQYRDEAADIIAAGRVVEVMDENYYTATSGQTVFTVNPPTPQQYLLVFMNSRKLRIGEDFTTDNPTLASQVILNTGADSGDEIDITLFNSIDGSA